MEWRAAVGGDAGGATRRAPLGDEAAPALVRLREPQHRRAVQRGQPAADGGGCHEEGFERCVDGGVTAERGCGERRLGEVVDGTEGAAVLRQQPEAARAKLAPRRAKQLLRVRVRQRRERRALEASHREPAHPKPHGARPAVQRR
eukprot:4761887-Prymnesium_polylepis.1